MMVVATWSVLPAKRHTRRKNSSAVSRAERVANILHAEHEMESSVVRICEYLKDFTCSSPARRLDQSMRIKAAGPAVLGHAGLARLNCLCTTQPDIDVRATSTAWKGAPMLRVRCCNSTQKASFHQTYAAAC
jgi:hypothetical protein